MSGCEVTDKSAGTCAPTSEESSGEAKEGLWIGISIGALLVIIVIAWLIRTCTNKQRRERALRRYCCKDKGKTETSTESRGPCQATEASAAPVYYNPYAPPPYDDAVKGSPRPTKRHVEDENDEAEAAFSKGRHVHKLSLILKKSISNISLNLAPIEEDAEEPKHGSQPTLPSNKNHQLERAPVPNRCVSHPSRLSSMGNSIPHFSLWNLELGDENEDDKPVNKESQSSERNGVPPQMNGTAFISCDRDSSSETVVEAKNTKNNQMNVDSVGVMNSGSESEEKTKDNNGVIIGIYLNSDNGGADDKSDKDASSKCDDKDIVVDMPE